MITEPPDWFTRNIRQVPRASFVEVEGCAVHCLEWGEPDKPGLVFVPGVSAFGYWFAPIAPLFADRFHVVSLDFPGMGDAGWRESYSQAQRVRELTAVLEHTGLFARGRRPIIVAHSFGGMVAALYAAAEGRRLAGLVLCDVARAPPNLPRPLLPDGSERPLLPSEKKYYPTREAALARYRLAPDQPCENKFYLDYLAPLSLREEPGKGWTWKFDIRIFTAMGGDPLTEAPSWGALGCRMAVMYGANSAHADMLGLVHAETRGRVPVVLLPEAHHHLFLDQPLAFASVVDAFATQWLIEDGLIEEAKRA